MAERRSVHCGDKIGYADQSVKFGRPGDALHHCTAAVDMIAPDAERYGVSSRQKVAWSLSLYAGQPLLEWV